MNPLDTKTPPIVVNVKVVYIRPQYPNLKVWSEDPQNLYIGRRGIVFVDGERFPKKDSLFANPFRVGKTCSREESLEKYRTYLISKIENGDITIEDLQNLQGKNLGCWCVLPPTDDTKEVVACHGHVLIEIMKKYLCDD